MVMCLVCYTDHMEDLDVDAQPGDPAADWISDDDWGQSDEEYQEEGGEEEDEEEEEPEPEPEPSRKRQRENQ